MSHLIASSVTREVVPAPRWPEAVLVFDTETTVEPDQRLLIGFHRVGTWSTDGAGRPVLDVAEEGVLYGDDLPTRDPQGFRRLQRFVAAHRYQIVSAQNLSFVDATTRVKDKFVGKVRITSPEDFWSTSKFLIVVED